ncbi:hypothetical protein MRX96_016428 [Rhipicephalus microplus]
MKVDSLTRALTTSPRSKPTCRRCRESRTTCAHAGQDAAAPRLRSHTPAPSSGSSGSSHPAEVSRAVASEETRGCRFCSPVRGSRDDSRGDFEGGGPRVPFRELSDE